MRSQMHQDRIDLCSSVMKEAGFDVLLLTKPSNMFYLTGDGRLCAYANRSSFDYLWKHLGPFHRA